MAKKTNIEINGNKYYRVTRTIGHKSDGTPIRKTFYGSGVNEANQKADEYMSNIQNGLIVDFDKTIFKDLMKSWLFDFLHNSSTIKPSTFQRYESIYRNYIVESDFANDKLIEVTSMKIQKYYNELSKTKTYSQVYNVNKVLKIFFNWCISNDYLTKNPTDKVNIKGNKTEIINNKKKEVETLSSEDISLIRNHLKGSNEELLFVFDLYTGLRLGELLALDYKDINFNDKTVTINKSVKEVYIYDDDKHKHLETILQTPKTLNSFRTVPLADEILNLLDKNKTGLIFCDNEGNYLKGKNVSSDWAKMLKYLNIEHKKFHAIRHTFASTLLRNGVDIQSVSDLLGHTTLGITQIYLHSNNTTKQVAINNIKF